MKELEPTEVVHSVQGRYFELCDDLERVRKQEKVTNDMLSQVQEASTLELDHIEKVITKENNAFRTLMQLFEKFAGWVRAEAALKQIYFNFHHIPDLILRKQVTKADYAQIKRLLLKVKTVFL